MIYNTFWRRVGAYLVDMLVFTPLAMADGFVKSSELGPVILISWLVFTHFIHIVYSVIMHSRYGQTVGKMATGVMVVNVQEDRTPSIKQMLLRESFIILMAIGSLANLIPLILSGQPVNDPEMYMNWQPQQIFMIISGVWLVADIGTMAVNFKTRALHDFIAGTVVVRIRRKPRS